MVMKPERGQNRGIQFMPGDFHTRARRCIERVQKQIEDGEQTREEALRWFDEHVASHYDRNVRDFIRSQIEKL